MPHPLAGAVRRDAGDAALVLEFGDRIERALIARVAALDRHVRALEATGRLEGLLETVPTFRSLALLLDPLVTTPDRLHDAIAAPLAPGENGAEAPRPREWLLPVRYGDDGGADLDEVAERCGLAPETVVERHEGTPLTVYMLGFLPGFAFLGEIDETLRLPRRATPRTRVPAGSVAIANALSAVYPWESPGGWHLIGHCPLPLFDARREEPALLGVGDRVRFERVDAEAHARIARESESGTLDPERFRRA